MTVNAFRKKLLFFHQTQRKRVLSMKAEVGLKKKGKRKDLNNQPRGTCSQNSKRNLYEVSLNQLSYIL